MACLQWLNLLACWVLLVAVGLPGRAQAPAEASEEKLTTLHVYADLIQVPVLVLDSFGNRRKPVDPAQFRVSLDSGPEFRPRRVRQQGKDPIALGILLDTSEQDSARWLENVDFAIASLAPEGLEARDHVSVYGFDCKLIRSLNGMSANPAQLKVGVDVALKPWRTRLAERRRDCEDRVSLWDAMRFAVRDMTHLPGRRALLVVTPGAPSVSAPKWNELRSEAQQEGVAVFGMVPSSAQGWGRENAFSEVCELSGGLLMRGRSGVDRDQLGGFVAMLRERYIVEFRRARNEAAGSHSIVVTVGGRRAYVRPAGVAVSLPDPEAKADPTTVRDGAAEAPEFGKRRVLTPK